MPSHDARAVELDPAAARQGARVVARTRSTGRHSPVLVPELPGHVVAGGGTGREVGIAGVAAEVRGRRRGRRRRGSGSGHVGSQTEVASKPSSSCAPLPGVGQPERVEYVRGGVVVLRLDPHVAEAVEGANGGRAARVARSARGPSRRRSGGAGARGPATWVPIGTVTTGVGAVGGGRENVRSTFAGWGGPELDPEQLQKLDVVQLGHLVHSEDERLRHPGEELESA